MKMIAVGTVHGRKVARPRDEKDPQSKTRYEDVVVAPNDEFDTDELEISGEEADRLVKLGVARRKTRQVPDDSAQASQPSRQQTSQASKTSVTQVKS